MTDLTHDTDIAAAADDASNEVLRRHVARLRGALDLLLPIARLYSGVAQEHGGPSGELFVTDPDDPKGEILPEVLQAEQALHATTGIETPRAESAGFEAIPQEEYLDDQNAEAPACDEPTIESTLLQAASLLQAINAHRIAALEPPAEIVARYEDALKALVGLVAAQTA